MNDPQAVLKKNQAFLEEMHRRIDAGQCEVIWQDAQRRLDEFYRRYEDLPKGVRLHTDNQIFPTSALYLALRDACGQQTAYQIEEDCMREKATRTGAMYARMASVPGFKPLFLKLWDVMSHQMYSDKSGFRNIFYPKAKGEFRMDITACPYQRYTAELGCPEIMVLFCNSDIYAYGDIPGMTFTRAQTLGTGGEKCDFCLRITGR